MAISARSAHLVAGFNTLCLLLLASVLHEEALEAQKPDLVADIQQSEELQTWNGIFSVPGVTASYNGDVYFLHNDGVHGLELWRTDGTAESTDMVSDICPGSCPGLGSATQLTVFDGRLYFAAEDGVSGIELWSTDGTTGATKMVADILPDQVGPGVPLFYKGSSNPQWLTATANDLFFSAATSHDTCGLLALSTEQKLRTLRTFECETGSEVPARLTPFGDLLLFSAKEAPTGRELWVTDGTPEGTQLLKDIFPGQNDGLEYSHWLYGRKWSVGPSRVLFAANDSTHGMELWASDGTPEGTAMVADIEVGKGDSRPDEFFEWNSKILFMANSTLTGREIWTLSEGSDLPEPLDAVVPGPDGYANRFLAATSAGVFFRAYRPDVGSELFFTDGSTEGTHLVMDIDPGDVSSSLYPFDFRVFVEADRIVFPAFSSADGHELWVSDSTAAGTRLLTDLNPGNQHEYDFFDERASFSAPLPGGGHFLLASDSIHGWEPHRSDGTASSIDLLANADQQRSAVSCFPQFCTQLTVGSNQLSFPITEWETQDVAIAFSDGTSNGSRAVKPENLVGEWVLRFGPYAFLADQLYFPAGVNSSNDQTWVSDGSNLGTLPLADALATLPRKEPRRVINHNGSIYLFFYESNNGTNVSSVWRTDGTNPGTVKVGPFEPGELNQTQLPIENLYLRRIDTEGTNLWVVSGPSHLLDLVVELPELNAHVIAEVVDKATGAPRLFLAEPNDPIGSSFKLWSWSESSPLALLHDDLRTTKLRLDLLSFGAPTVAFAGDHLIFVGSSLETGPELWATDGTQQGTFSLIDINPGSPGSSIGWLTQHEDEVFFAATSPHEGRELWRTQGTPHSTRIVADLVPESGSSLPQWLTSVGSDLFFTAWDPEIGVELWKLPNKTPHRAELVADIYPGPESSSPGNLILAFGDLFFLANDGTHGLELHRLGVSSVFGDGFESGDLTLWSSQSTSPWIPQ